MVKTPDGILGVFTGSIGPVVGSSWKGIPYVKTKPRKTDRSKPRTEGRMANEEKFKFGNNWLKPFHKFITIGFANLAIRKTEISAAFSYHFKHAITGVFPDLDIDYTKVMVSMGPLPQLTGASIEFVAANTVKLSWPLNTERYAEHDDQVMLVLYNKEIQFADGFIGGIKRNAGECSYKIHSKLYGKPLEVYAGLFSINRKLISDSIYLGQILPTHNEEEFHQNQEPDQA